MERHKNSTAIVGRKLSTLPTPAHTPSTTSEHTAGLTLAAARPAPMASVARPTRNPMPSESHAPGPANVRANTAAMSAKKQGMPVKRPVRMRSAATLRRCERLSCGRTTVASHTRPRNENRMSARAASRSSPDSRSMTPTSWSMAASCSGGRSSASRTGASPSMSFVAAKRTGSPAARACDSTTCMVAWTHSCTAPARSSVPPGWQKSTRRGGSP